MGFNSLLKKIKSIRLIDVFSPKRWRSVYIFLLRKHLKCIDGSEWTPEIHEVEQYMFRLLSCVECVRIGKCVGVDSCKGCGCLIPARMWNRTDYCSCGKWGEFMSKEEWDNYKDEYGVELILNFTKKKK